MEGALSCEDRVTGFRVSDSFMGTIRASRVSFMDTILKGSWDLVTRVITKVTILIITYNPNQGTYNLTY